MTDAPIKGYEYQALFFLIELMKLKTSDYHELVTFECSETKVVDDVIVRYFDEGILDRDTGKYVKVDYYQLKYHVSQNGAFSSESLLDKSFTGTAEPILKRLYGVYKRFIDDKSGEFRLNIVSSWTWDHRDTLSEYLREGRFAGNFERDFLRCSDRSKMGKVRRDFVSVLGISAEKVVEFLSCLRFRLGKGISDLSETLNEQLKMSDLKLLPNTSSNEYTYLPWMLYRQGKNEFDKSRLDDVIKTEGLQKTEHSDFSELSLCSMKMGFRRPKELRAAHLDITELFDGRFPIEDSVWKTEIPERVKEFLFSSTVENLSRPLCLFFDCHLSIAFLAGALSDLKKGMDIIPAQKIPVTGYELWTRPAGSPKDFLWNCQPSDQEVREGKEVVIGVSVSQPINKYLDGYLESGVSLLDAPKYVFKPSSGVGRTSIANGEEAWHLSENLAILLRETLPSRCRKLHVFLAVPAAMAFMLGDTFRGIAPEIQLYEYDFEGTQGETRYKPSINVTI